MPNPHEQLSIPLNPPSPEFDAASVARHIGEHASKDPYSSQNRRDQQIAERKSATYTDETLPEHLRDSMALAEDNFRKTAPGEPVPPVEDSIRAAREAVKAAQDEDRPAKTQNSALGALPKYIANRRRIQG